MKKLDKVTTRYLIEQIKKTKEILRNSFKEETISSAVLLNSLLSLVILPFERAKKQGSKEKAVKIFDGKYADLQKRVNFETIVFHPIAGCDGENTKYKKRTVYMFVNKLRNGIAHLNIRVENNENGEMFFVIYNIFNCNSCEKCKNKSCENKGLTYEKSGIVDFEVKFSLQQLQKIAIYIADSYLKAMQGE